MAQRHFSFARFNSPGGKPSASYHLRPRTETTPSWLSYAAKETSNVMDLPSVEEVMKMKLVKLVELCKKLNLEKQCAGFQKDRQYRDILLDYIKKVCRTSLKPTTAPLAVAALPFQQFAGKKIQFIELCNRVQCLLDVEFVRPWLEKLNIPLLREWMVDEDFLEVKESCTKGNPTLLVAGSTSSGKSTLLNALLGESILPTSHNASTSVLCEIKYSPDSQKKYAIMHLITDGCKEQVQLDLTDESHRKQFCAYIDKKSKSRDFLSYLKGKSNQPECWKVEIFWPLRFLQHFTLVDSPGVTEDDDENSTARKITEQFQRDVACGFIYVLDATRAVEEAGQVGGLLTALFKATKCPPSPGAALFVINKWDILDRQVKKNYKEQVFQRISTQWDGLKLSQLVEMDAQMAAKTQALGTSTDDMKNLCKGIQSIIPEGVNSLLLKGCNRLMNLLDQIEDSIEGTIRGLRLPTDERMRKHDEEWKQLQEFKQSRETGEISGLQKMVTAGIDHLVMQLTTYLRSEEANRFAVKWKKSELKEDELRSLKDKNAEYLVAERFCETIRTYKGYGEFSNWLNQNAMSQMLQVLRDIHDFKVKISSNRIARTSPKGPRKSRANTSSRSSMFDASTIAWAVPTALLGAPVALAVGVVGAPIYAVIQLIRHIKFKKAVDKGYREMVEHCCSKSSRVLRDIVTCLLRTTLEPAKLALTEIPELIDDLERELEARVKQEAEDLPSYERALEEVRDLRGHVANFVLSLRAHDHTVDDLEDWKDDKLANELKGQVVKKILKGQGAVALKVWDESLTEENADSLLKEIQRFKRFKGNPHLISFYGSILLQKVPIHLGLLFEYFDGKTLADEIFSPGRASSMHSEGFCRAKTIAVHILSGLIALHKKQVRHGRLSSETIVVAERGIVKIADLGLAKLGPVASICRDVAYMSPEFLEEQPLDYSSDMYSIGIVLWEVWTGRPAYENYNLSVTDQTFIDSIRSQELRPDKGDDSEPHGGENDEESISMSSSDDTVDCKWLAICSECWNSSVRQRPDARKALQRINELSFP